MNEDWQDDFEDEDDELEDEEEIEVADKPGLMAEEAEAAEAAARQAAVAQQDELIRELNGESDEPPVGPGTDEEREALGKFLESMLAERQAERERIAAVFENEAMDSDEASEELQPIDFSTWDSAAFGDLFDRVVGAKPFDAPRGTVSEELFEQGLMRMAEGN